jgi:hypothetical protein
VTDAKTIRAWAAAEGLRVPERGPLPRDLLDRYDDAHPELAETAPPPAADSDQPGDERQGDEDQGEKRPRIVPVQAGNRWKLRAAAAGRKKRKAPARPRVPVDAVITRAWQIMANCARPLPATSRLLRIQAPVAGVILEETVRGTLADRLLQPIARIETQGEAAFALAGPIICVAMLERSPGAAPLVMPVLREAMLAWVRVAGPKMKEALARETEFEEMHGASVDAMLAFIFAPLPDTDPAAAGAAEEQAIRRAQEDMAALPWRFHVKHSRYRGPRPLPPRPSAPSSTSNGKRSSCPG